MGVHKDVKKVSFLLLLACLLSLVSNAQYCSITYPNGGEAITLVNFGSINNTTSDTSTLQYEDFTAITTNALQGQSYAMTVKSNTYGNYSNYVRVFIDWNHNNLFTDAGESFDIGFVTNSTGIDAVQTSANITVPFTSSLGSTRMRVTAKYGAYSATGCNNSGWGQAEDYTLNILASNTCTGTPAAGTATGPSAVCPNAPFTVSLTGFTAASGISFQWQSNSGSGWTNIAGATNTSYSVAAGITTATSYKAISTCSNGGNTATSNAVAVTVNAPTQCYCTISFPSSGAGPISLVRFAGIDNTTTADINQPSYEDFTGMSTTVAQGATYPISIKGNSVGAYVDSFRVFVDWNQNGLFTDAGETYTIGYIYNSTGTDTITLTGNIAVPSTALTGATRMRVTKKWAQYAGPCNSSGYGQAEDYTILVCDNAPVSPGSIAGLNLVTPATTNSQKVSFIRGSGAGAIVVARHIPAPSMPPVSGVSYNVASPGYYTSANPALGGGRVIYNSGAVASGGTVTVFAKTLPSGAPIIYQVYEYNGTCVNPVPIATDTFYTLLAAPIKAAKVNAFSNVQSYSIKINWTNGGGTRRIAVLKEGSAVSGAPANNTNYSASTVFGSGDALGGGFVVYNGIDSTVTVTGLKAYTVYHVAVYEYNGPDANGDIMYQSPAPAVKNVTTAPDFAAWTKCGLGIAESFNDSLLNTGTGSKLPKGWFLYEAGTGGNTSYAAGTGSSATGNTYSFGAASAADRALGTLLTSTVMPQVGVKFRNSSLSDTVTSVLVIYNGEQWRRGNTTAGVLDSLLCYTSVDPATTRLNNGVWTRAPKLDFWSPVATTTAAALDGNLAANRKQVTASITGLSIPPGGYMWIKFVDADMSGNDDGLAIDDFEAVPFKYTVAGGGTIPALAALNDLNVTGGTATIASSVGTLNVKYALNIETGSVLDLGTTTAPALTVSHMVYGMGTITATPASKLTVGGPALNQTIYMTPGSNTIYTLTVKAGASATLGNMINIAAVPKAGSVKVGTATGSAILNAGGNLTLKSDTLYTSMIDDVYGAINGNVVVERALQNKAAIRLLGSPFSAALPLTGINGYTLSAGNLWYYDPATATPNGITGMANSANWTAYAYPSGTIPQYGVLRIFKDATPGVVLSAAGPVNQGPVTITPAAAADSFAVIGNPYPAGVLLNNALTGAGGNFNSAAVYTWDPSKAGNGAFVTVPNVKFSTAKLPSGGAFVAVLNPCCGAASFSFTEADKTATGNTHTSFKGEEEQSAATGLELTISKDGSYYDGVYIYFDAEAKPSMELNRDAVKISNPGLDLYTQSPEGRKLAVDIRPYEAGKTIALGLANAEKGVYTLNTTDWNLPSGAALYLVDDHTGDETMLDARSAYSFEVNGHTGNSENRFHLRMGEAGSAIAGDAVVGLSPNPARDRVTISINMAEEAAVQIKIISISGQQMFLKEVPSVMKSSIEIPLTELPAGVYFAEVTVNGKRISRKLIKQ